MADFVAEVAEEESGLGRLAPDGSAEYVPVMRFETTTAKPLVKEMPTHLVELSAASQASAVRRLEWLAPPLPFHRRCIGVRDASFCIESEMSRR
jgi:hypothetical protein